LLVNKEKVPWTLAPEKSKRYKLPTVSALPNPAEDGLFPPKPTRPASTPLASLATTPVESTAKNFELSEVSADKAYLSTKNVEAIRNAGALPFIAFKSNSTERGVAGQSQVWRDMFYFFMWKRDEFLKCYHKRSNVETAFSMMKRKFGDSLRSKTDTAMINEALCKILCHNLSVLIHEIHELGIAPAFCLTE
jgi:hypothetical protein